MNLSVPLALVVTSGKHVYISKLGTYQLFHLEVVQFKKILDMVSPDLKSHVIYEFKCSTCTSGYIGETRVHFKTRNCQHLGISPFTEKPLSSCVNTAVTEHIKHNQCKSNLKDFKIIGTEQDYYKRLIKESLFIKLRDYDLNKQHTSTTLYLF